MFFNHNHPPLRSPDERAMDLLLRHLDADQRRQLLTFGYFDTVFMVSPDRKMIARLHNVQHGLVEVNRMTYCAIPMATLPVADETLTKLLMLQARPFDFFGRAQPQGDVAKHILHNAILLAPGYTG